MSFKHVPAARLEVHKAAGSVSEACLGSAPPALVSSRRPSPPLPSPWAELLTDPSCFTSLGALWIVLFVVIAGPHSAAGGRDPARWLVRRTGAGPLGPMSLSLVAPITEGRKTAAPPLHWSFGVLFYLQGLWPPSTHTVSGRRPSGPRYGLASTRLLQQTCRVCLTRGEGTDLDRLSEAGSPGEVRGRSRGAIWVVKQHSVTRGTRTSRTRTCLPTKCLSSPND